MRVWNCYVTPGCPHGPTSMLTYINKLFSNVNKLFILVVFHQQASLRSLSDENNENRTDKRIVVVFLTKCDRFKVFYHSYFCMPIFQVKSCVLAPCKPTSFARKVGVMSIPTRDIYSSQFFY